MNFLSEIHLHVTCNNLYLLDLKVSVANSTSLRSDQPFFLTWSWSSSGYKLSARLSSKHVCIFSFLF